jgi:nucleolar protein 56
VHHITTWFGTFIIENDTILSCDLLKKDVKILVDHLLSTPGALESSMVCGRNIRSLAKESGFVTSDKEYDDLFRDVNIEYAVQKVAASRSYDHVLIRSIEALDELDRITNVLSERLKELYDLNYPELELQGEPLVRFISKYGTRESNTKWDTDDNTILHSAVNSLGLELPRTCADNIKDMASNICGLYNNRDRLSQYIEAYMGENFTNLSKIAGVSIGARLISIAGSTRKLSSMPSGTIQVLGAQKALFKHLKGQAPSPKHGVIFQHPLIKESPWWLRGKIARALACKISLAVRVDYYSGDYREEIAEDLNKRVETLQKQFPYPPKRKV